MRRRENALHKNKYMLLSFAAVLGYCLPVYSLDSGSVNVHAAITRDALGGTLSEANLKAIIDANESQDKPTADAAEKRRHFDAASITAAMSYINREKNTALNLAAEADSDGESRSDALRHFGLMLHTVQDFYLRSNYVEMALEQPANRTDPYNIALVDWSHVPDAYVSEASGAKLTSAKNGDPTDILNKDSAESAGGKAVVSGKITTFQVARELAVRETQRQWNLFETLVRARCGNRASSVLAALRQAPPEKKTE